MEKIQWLVQTEKDLISINERYEIIGRINSTNMLLGYDENEVMLLYHSGNLLFTSESRNPDLSLKSIHHDPLEICANHLESNSSKHFPLYSFRVTNQEYTEFLKVYAILENEERKRMIWKIAYSHILTFFQFLGSNKIKLQSDFHASYLNAFEYQIEQDLLFKSKKSINFRMQKVFEKLI